MSVTATLSDVSRLGLILAWTAFLGGNGAMLALVAHAFYRGETDKALIYLGVPVVLVLYVIPKGR
jgi:hypothetical protein